MVWLLGPLAASSVAGQPRSAPLASAQEMLAGGRSALAHCLNSALPSLQGEPRVGDAAIELIWILSALAATAPGGHDPHAAVVALGRDWLRSIQRLDGTFLDPPHAAEATLYAINVLRGAGGAADLDAARRAGEHVPRFAAAAAPPSPARGAQDPLAAALSFLARNQAGRGSDRGGASSAASETADGLLPYAGGSFDARLARQALRRDVSASLTAQLGLPRRGGMLQDIHLAARVLADMRSPRIVDERGRTRPWPQELLAATMALRAAARGKWSPAPGAEPSGAATAAAVLALDALTPWLTAAPDATLAAAAGREASDVAVLPADCVDCHDKLHPNLVHQWRESRHRSAGVGCDACHGKNHSQIFRENGAVSPRACAQCHPGEVAEFAGSRHAAAEATLLTSALFEATPPAERAACRSCHAIGKTHADGATGACNYCHSSHAAKASEARQPEACTGCHTGDDYPQDLAYRLSRHGAIYYTSRDARLAPTCVTCHQPGGHHGTSFGITIGGIGTGGHLAGDEPAVPMVPVSAQEFAESRAAMVRVCVPCHSSRFAEDSLAGADRIKRDGNLKLLEARNILLDLHAAGRLGDARAGPPLLGGRQVRLDPGAPGAAPLNAFYEMWRFDYAWTWKGAYHSSPSVANLESRAGLDAAVSALRAESNRLRKPEGGR